MYKRKLIYRACCLAALVLLRISLFCQVTVSGPTCVISGTIYLYDISANWDSASTMQVCVNGGTLTDSTGNITCSINGAPISSIKVNWNDLSNASITVTSSKGNTTLNINITDQLKAGAINSSDKMQTVNYDVVPSTIGCTPDTGGSCSPAYSNQWQQSLDALAWTNIPGAYSQNLGFSTPLQSSMYYRRKVTETVSGTIAYSDIATVNVYPQPTIADSLSGLSGRFIDVRFFNPIDKAIHLNPQQVQNQNNEIFFFSFLMLKQFKRKFPIGMIAINTKGNNFQVPDSNIF